MDVTDYGHRSRDIVFIICYGFAISLFLLFGLTQSVRAQVPLNEYILGEVVQSENPITVTTRVRLQGELEKHEEIVLAGLFTEPDDGKGVTLRWVNRSSGWFPDWELQVVSTGDWLESNGIETISGGAYQLRLASVLPKIGDVYEALLSYHPSGRVSLALRNVTKDVDVYMVTLGAKLPSAPLFPGTGWKGTSADNEVRTYLDVLAFDRVTTYIQKGIPIQLKHDFSWALVRNPDSLAPESVGDFDLFSSDHLGVRLNWPKTAIAGGVRVSAITDSEEVELFSANWKPEPHIVVLDKSLLPQELENVSKFRVDYVDDEYIYPLAERNVRIRDGERWMSIEPPNFSILSPDDFSDKELFPPYTLNRTDKHMPYYLTHFHRLANAVQQGGTHEGFIDLPIWRNEGDNEPYNARIMENILSLAYFYTTDRPWNPYYGSDAVRSRLESALDFWVLIQSEDGRFSEYAPERWNLAATAFATNYMGETLRLLHDGPEISREILARVIEAQRKAIMVVLTDEGYYKHGKVFTNQFENVWPGALAYLTLFADREMELALRQRITQSEVDFQSPAGYYYESNSVDWSYNIGTHRGIMRRSWHLSRGTDLANHFVKTESLWYDWLSYNAVREPDGSAFLLNRGIESRQRTGFIERLDTELAEMIPVAWAFATTREERDQMVAEQRAEVERLWPRVSPLQIGEFASFRPSVFLHQPIEPWHPTNGQRDQAVNNLPYLASPYFNHQRVDSRRPLVLTYIRRATYYAVFNVGLSQNDRQRFGLGLLWHPQAGGLIQTQSDSNADAWGTKPVGQVAVYEKEIRGASFEFNGSPWFPEPGARDMPQGELMIHYTLGSNGHKAVSFDDHAIRVQVEHPGDFMEYIPLLKAPGDSLLIEEGSVVLRRDGKLLAVNIIGDGTFEELPEASDRVGRYEVITIRITAKESLTYQLEIKG